MAIIEVLPQLVIAATTPLKVTLLSACVFPKPLPVMITELPALPEIGERESIFSAIGVAWTCAVLEKFCELS